MEVADQVASARAAPATNESSKRSAAPLPRAGAGAMRAMSLLFVCLAAVTLRRCGAMDEEEVFRGFLWGLSPLICAYLYSWTAAFSPAAPWAKRVGAEVARVAFLLLVAFAADKLIGPIAGAAAIVLATLLSAFACGRALAKHRQRAGTERWSAATVASTPIYQSRAEEAEERRRKAGDVSFVMFLVVSFAATVCMLLWFAPETEGDASQMQFIFFLAGPLIPAVWLMPWCMDGSPVLANMDDSHAIGAVIGVIGWLVAIFAGVGSGFIAGAVVFWTGELCLVGFIGYSTPSRRTTSSSWSSKGGSRVG